MGRAARLLRNITANWLGFAVNALVTLLLTPFVLQTLGEARYGIWVISSSIVGYYGLLDLGFRGSINQYLTRHLSVGDHERASATMSTAVVALGSLGGLFALLSVATAFAAPHVWNFPAGMEREAFWCILIVGATAALQFAFFPFTAVFVATQRFDIANLIGVTTRIATAGAVYAALSGGHGLIGISAATCALSLVDYVIRWRVARRLAPQLVIERRRASVEQFKALASFGAWTFLIALNGFVYLHAQPLLIGALLPIAAVGYYALATGLLQQINGAISPIGQVMYPVATALHAQGERDSMLRLYHDGSRLMMLVMVLSVLGAAFWAEDFYRLWVGAKYVSGEQYPSVALLLQILLLSTATSYVSNVGGQILMGSGRVKLVALLLIGGSMVNLLVSILLLHSVGLVGAAIATVLASLMVDLLAMPMAVSRTIGLPVASFLRHACLRPLAVAVVVASAFAALRFAAGSAETWRELLAQGALAGAIGLAIIAVLGITSHERQRFIVRPLLRLLSRAARTA